MENLIDLIQLTEEIDQDPEGKPIHKQWTLQMNNVDKVFFDYFFHPYEGQGPGDPFVNGKIPFKLISKKIEQIEKNLLAHKQGKEMPVSHLKLHQAYKKLYKLINSALFTNFSPNTADDETQDDTLDKACYNEIDN